MTNLFALLIFGATLHYQKIEYPQYRPTRDDMDTMIEMRMEDLAFCESTNNSKAYVHDDGGSPSYGLFQYKIPTAKWFNEKYNLGFHIDEKTIFDINIQKELTRHALADNQYRHWYNCSRKYGWLR